METWQLLLTAVGAYAAICGGFGIYVAAEKNRSFEAGLAFGLLLGPAGLILLACLPDGTTEEDAAAYAAQIRAAVEASESDQAARRQARRLLGEVED